MHRRLFLFYCLNFLFFLFGNLSWIKKTKGKPKVLENQTIILTHPIFLDHIISEGHPENPERINYILKRLQKDKLYDLVSYENYNDNEKKWIKLIHSNTHINSLKKKFPIAEKASAYAVKSCIHGVNEILRGNAKNVFCAVRPPGHHALNTGKDEGFCFYNHVAITAKYLQAKHKIKRILIVDWDYHHGNSTELFFYNDPSVLFFSTHDVNAYPRTGLINRIGTGKGEGFNVNIHLPCGTNDKNIIKIYKEKLTQKASSFKPEFVIISAGFDSRINDPLGCFNITDKGFMEITKIVMNISEEHCEGKLLSVLEGGYNLSGNANAVSAHIQILNNFNKKV